MFTTFIQNFRPSVAYRIACGNMTVYVTLICITPASRRSVQVVQKNQPLRLCQIMMLNTVNTSSFLLGRTVHNYPYIYSIHAILFYC